MSEGTSGPGILDRIRYHERGYSAVEEAIARAIIADPRGVIAEPIEAFAARIGVSAGSVVRFARTLGFPGYRALKYELASVAGMPGSLSRLPGEKGLFEAEIRALQFASQSLDISAVATAGEMLVAARRVELAGAGAASATARALEFQLTILGLACRRLEDPREAAAAAGFLRRGDVLVAISHSGRTRDTVDAARRAHTSGAGIIVITSMPGSPLGRLGSVVLSVDASGTRYARDERPFRVVHLAVVQLLGAAVERALTPEERGHRNATWASARFSMRYGDQDGGPIRSSDVPQPLTE